MQYCTYKINLSRLLPSHNILALHTLNYNAIYEKNNFTALTRTSVLCDSAHHMCDTFVKLTDVKYLFTIYQTKLEVLFKR